MPRTKKAETEETEKVAKKTAKKTTEKKAPVKKTTKKVAEVEETAQVVEETPKAEKAQVENAKKAERPVEKEAREEVGSAAKDLASASKQQIIEQYATKDGDTGSPEVQIALSTQKIFNLSQHLTENPKDNHSRRGLLKIIAKRRRILHYLQGKDEPRYKGLIKKLGLKK